MVKEKQPLGQGVEVDLISDDKNISIIQKIIPGLPDGVTNRAGLKGAGFPLLFIHLRTVLLSFPYYRQLISSGSDLKHNQNRLKIP